MKLLRPAHVLLAVFAHKVQFYLLVSYVKLDITVKVVQLTKLHALLPLDCTVKKVLKKIMECLALLAGIVSVMP